MKLLRVLTAIIFSGIVCSAFAQNEYPAEVDSAWIASQNGGSTELNDGNSEEAPACIGDGCNGTETATTASTAPEQDTTAKEKSSGNESDEEDCTPADSLLPECKDDQPVSRYDDDDDDTYDRYANENAELSREAKIIIRRMLAGSQGQRQSKSCHTSNLEENHFLGTSNIAHLPIIKKAPQCGASYKGISF